MTSDSGKTSAQPINQQMLSCIQKCTSCHAVCLHTQTVMLYSEQLAHENRLIRLLADCTEVCQTSADFMLRGSSLHGLICDACSRICTACAEACEEIPGNENLAACAETCRSCASACQTMAVAPPNWRDQDSGM